MNKINLESDLLTDKRKAGVITYFTVSETIALALWAYDWPMLAVLCNCLAIRYAIDIYKAEVFYNTKNGNKEFIKKWLIFFLVLLGFASVVLGYLGSRYSSLFVITLAFLQAVEVGNLGDFDKNQNGNLANEPDIFEKHYHIKTLLIPLAVILLGIMIFGNID